MLQQVRAVIFDIGNVLVEWRPEPFYDSVIGPEARARLFAKVDLHGMNLGLDRGDPWKATVYALADRHPDWADAIRLWHDRWVEMVDPPIERSFRMLKALKARGMPVFALTNFGAESFLFAQARMEFLRHFDREYVSGRLGLLKPDPAIYAAVEADCGLPPESLFFTDDNPANTAAAAARGWQVHTFDGPQGLADRLVALGLLTEAQAA